jgi:hypothetical protein
MEQLRDQQRQYAGGCDPQAQAQLRTMLVAPAPKPRRDVPGRVHVCINNRANDLRGSSHRSGKIIGSAFSAIKIALHKLNPILEDCALLRA